MFCKNNGSCCPRRKQHEQDHQTTNVWAGDNSDYLVCPRLSSAVLGSSWPSFAPYRPFRLNIGKTVEAHILSFLTVREHVGCAVICKYFGLIAALPESWNKTVDLFDGEHDVTTAMLQSLNKLRCTASRLVLSVTPNDQRHMTSTNGDDLLLLLPSLSAFLKHQTRLKSLELHSQCTAVFTNLLALFPPAACDKINTLDIHTELDYNDHHDQCEEAHQGYRDLLASLARFTNLTHFTLRDECNFDENIMPHLVNHFPTLTSLKHLHIQCDCTDSTRLLTAEQLQKLSMATPNLTYLRAPVDPEASSAFTNWKHLSHIAIDYGDADPCWLGDDEPPRVLDVSGLAACRDLRALEVINGKSVLGTCGVSTDEQIAMRTKSKQWLRALTGLPLTRLDIDETPLFSPTDLIMFAPTLIQLKATQFYQFENMPQFTLVLPKLTFLTRLELSHHMTDRHVKALANLVHLEYLAISAEVTGWGFEFVCNALTKLETLDLSHNAKLNGTTMLPFLAKFPALEKLNIGRTSMVAAEVNIYRSTHPGSFPKLIRVED